MIRICRFTLPSGASEYAVYRGDHLVRTCPSIGMAREVAAGAAA